MRAARIMSLDGPAAVRVVDVSPPVATGDQILVDVRSAGVTFPDVLLTRGLYQLKPELPFTPGSEVAGVVAAAPPGAHVAVGDRVAAFCVLGGFAEQVLSPPETVWPLPDALDFRQGAALPMNYLTCHFALVRRGALAAGETVLIHGAAGGIGTAAIQVAKAWGARVIAVVSTDLKAQVAREAGADDVVPAEGFLAAVKDLTAGRGVDVIVDPVGGDRFTDSLRCLAPEGRLLVIGFTAGDIPTVRVNRLLLNNVDVRGVGWGAFAMTSPGYLDEQWRDLAGPLASGALRPVLGRSFPLERAADALAELDQRSATGKVTIEP